MDALIYALICLHLSGITASLYLHRGVSHGLFTFHPVIEHFFRFWMWLTDGVITRDWVSQHRKHHKYTDVDGDPHSPKIFGIYTVAWKGFFSSVYYRYKFNAGDWVKNHYSKGIKNDWLEKNIYSKYPRLGLLFLLLINIILFGSIGFIIWFIQLIWVPFWSNCVITGYAHWCGYQQKGSKDNSRNLFPIGLLMLGEELHNNHHCNPCEPNLRHRWFEFDLGWQYIKILKSFNLVKINTMKHQKELE